MDLCYGLKIHFLHETILKNIYYHEHFHKGENIIFLEDRDETLLHVPGNGCVEIIVHVTGNTERVIVLCRRRRI